MTESNPLECSVPGCPEEVRCVCACDTWCLEHFLQHIDLEDECRSEFEEQVQVICAWQVSASVTER